MRKLGRLIEKDQRDRMFAMKPQKASSDLTYKFWYTSPAYDQGMTSQCVAYSGIKYLDTGPIRNRDFDVKKHFSFTDLYRDCQRNDAWDGEEYDGTSVRALFKILKRDGYVDRYEWAFDLATVVNHVLTTGPVVMGTWWTEDMFDVDDRGFIHATGSPAGGHAYLLKGVNKGTWCTDGSRGAFRIINSWGNWGQNGCASISFNDLEALLLSDGEACAAHEVQLLQKY